MAAAKKTTMDPVRSILVSQPKPENGKSPYLELARKHKVKVEFRKFIRIEGLTSQEFRKSRVNISNHTAIIFTSRNAIDQFFRLCGEMRIAMPDNMKYFCISDAIGFYLQKYVIYRKRKIFNGRQTFADLMEIIVKHKGEKFLLPSSDILKPDIPKQLNEQKIYYTRAICYRTVCSDLSDLAKVNFDMLVFFSPMGITSLFKNFPRFKQNKTRIAAFGPTTAKAVKDAGLTLNVPAPVTSAPSMTMAIEQYLLKANKKK